MTVGVALGTGACSDTTYFIGVGRQISNDPTSAAGANTDAGSLASGGAGLTLGSNSIAGAGIASAAGGLGSGGSSGARILSTAGTSSSRPRLTWVSKAPMPTPRCEFGTVVLGGLIYTIGGTVGSPVGIVEVYDPTTNSWSTRASMPTPRQMLVTAASAGLIYAIGGFQKLGNSRITYTNVTEIYDPSTDTWVTDPVAPLLPNARNDVPGDQLIAGGAISEHIYVAVLDDPNLLLDFAPASSTWTRIPGGAPLIRDGIVATVQNDRLYLLETKDSLAGNGAKFGAFDPATGYWYSHPSIPIRNVVLPFNQALASVAGAVYAIGGSLYDTVTTVEVMSAQVLRFAPETNAWEEDSCLPHPRHTIGLATAGDTIYAIGGSVEPYNRIPTGELNAGRYAPDSIGGSLSGTCFDWTGSDVNAGTGGP